MEFYFIRHAQSENNALYARTGSMEGRHSDPRLTSPGREQAHRVAQHLAQPHTPSPYDPHNFQGFGLTHLYCSLMVRAVETGTAIAQTTGLPLVAWPEIHERGGIIQRDPDTQEWQGLPGHNRAFFEANFPNLVLPNTLGETGWWNRPMETREQLAGRAQIALAQLRQRHNNSDARIAIVSHGAFFDAFYGALLKTQFTHPSTKADSYLWFTVHNTAISRIDFDGNHVNLVYTNRVNHLDAHLITH